ncbi:mitochondrial import inner membrane translocase subunit tim54 [Rhizophlyctis rosea]|nr:mitochondrial import inner membrane translocase subunit tim54 [Rhizophlyctis rosea]
MLGLQRPLLRSQGLIPLNRSFSTPAESSPVAQPTQPLQSTTTPQPPAPKGWRSKLPSRNWLIFIGVTSTIAALASYDRWRLSQIRAELAERADVLAKEKLPTTEMPRKVRVYLAHSQWAKWWFEQYVKPVFDAAALDYDIIQPKRPNQIRIQLRDHIWAGKSEFARGVGVGQRYDPRNPTPNYTFILDRPAYDPTEGVVAIGPNPWREVLRGLNEGCLANEPPKLPVTEDPQPEQELILSTSNIPTFTLPAVGYIPARHLTGWLNFPLRIFNFFTQRNTAREVGEEALKVAFGRVQEFKVGEDEALGSKDVTEHGIGKDELTEEEKRSIDEVHVAPEVGIRLWIYA